MAAKSTTGMPGGGQRSNFTENDTGVKSVKHVTMDDTVQQTEIVSREKAFTKEEKPRERRIQQLRRKRSGSGYSVSGSEEGRRGRSGSQYSEEGSIYSETGKLLRPPHTPTP